MQATARELFTAEMVRRPLRLSLGRQRAPDVPWVALVCAASIVATALATGAFLHEIPRSLGARWSTGWPALRAGRWWTLGTSFVLTRDWFMASTMPICLVVPLGLYERRAGHVRAIAVVVLGHVVGTIVLSVLFAPLATTHVSMLVRAANNLDYGGSMAIAAACGALASLLEDRAVRRLLVIIVLGALAAHHQMADWGHLVAAPIGYLADRVRLHQPAAAFVTALAVVLGMAVLLAPISVWLR